MYVCWKTTSTAVYWLDEEVGGEARRSATCGFPLKQSTTAIDVFSGGVDEGAKEWYHLEKTWAENYYGRRRQSFRTPAKNVLLREKRNHGSPRHHCIVTVDRYSSSPTQYYSTVVHKSK